MMKTKGKRKFFKCLEPLGAVDAPGKSKRSDVDGTETDDYSLGSGQGRGGGGDFIAGLLKLSSSSGDRKFESANGGIANDRPENSRRSFSRVIKAVLFEKSLLRKFRKKGSSRSTSASTSANLSPESDHNMTKLSKEKRLSKETTWGTDELLGGNSSDSSDTSLFSSSTMTSSSTSCASSRSASERKISSPRAVKIQSPRSVTFAEPKQATLNEEASLRETLFQKQAKSTAAVKEPRSPKPARPATVTLTKRYNSNIMCFIVLSLIALVFWGKALAIVCTSAWLYMVPRSFEWVADSPEIDSDEVYWNRIVNERMSEETSLSLRLASN